MKHKTSTLDKIAHLTGLRDANNEADRGIETILSTTHFDTGGFAQSKMDSPVFDRNPDPWSDPKKKK